MERKKILLVVNKDARMFPAALGPNLCICVCNAENLMASFESFHPDEIIVDVTGLKDENLFLDKMTQSIPWTRVLVVNMDHYKCFFSYADHYHQVKHRHEISRSNYVTAVKKILKDELIQ